MSKEISANSHLISRLPVETTIDMLSKAKHPKINYINFERLALKPIWIPIEKSEFSLKTDCMATIKFEKWSQKLK